MAGRADEPSVRLSLGPASRLLGVHPDTLRRWADDGRVEAYVSPGGHRRFERSEIERVLAGGQAADTTGRLASIGATPDRLSRAYRRSYQSQSRHRSARSASSPADREAFRADGRALVASLVAYLDAPDDAARAAAESNAATLTDDLARRLATGGLSVTESVGLFVAARRPFLSELGVVARRRSLEAERVSELFEEASALLDRLLVRLVAAYEGAAP